MEKLVNTCPRRAAVYMAGTRMYYVRPVHTERQQPIRTCFGTLQTKDDDMTAPSSGSERPATLFILHAGIHLLTYL